MKNSQIIMKILEYFEASMDDDELDMNQISPESLGISQNRWITIMEQLSNCGYIDGLSIRRSADGDVELSIWQPRITLEGSLYIEQNSAMRKTVDLIRTILEVLGNIIGFLK